MNFFKEKNVLITGSNRGIGYSIAKTLSSKGANIIFCVRKKNEKLIRFVNSFKNKKNKIIFFNLENTKQMKKEIKKLYKDYEKIDFLINNAAEPHGSIFELISDEKIKKIFQVNFFSQLELIQLLLRLLKKSKNSHIINIASISGVFPQRGNLAYGTSKAALIFASKILSKELKNYKIKVTSISPGLVKTDMLNLMSKNSIQEVKNKLKIKKIYNPKKIANLILNILSNKMKNTNGKNIILK